MLAKKWQNLECGVNSTESFSRHVLLKMSEGEKYKKMYNYITSTYLVRKWKWVLLHQKLFILGAKILELAHIFKLYFFYKLILIQLISKNSPFNCNYYDFDNFNQYNPLHLFSFLYPVFSSPSLICSLRKSR